MGVFASRSGVPKDSTAWKKIATNTDEAGGWVQTTSVLPVTGVGCVVKVSTVVRAADGTYQTDEVLGFAPGVGATDANSDGTWDLSQIAGWQSGAGVLALSGTLSQALTTPLGATESYDVTVTGAALGDTAIASYSKALGAKVELTATVKAADTVQVTVRNNGSLLSGTLAQELTTAGGATEGFDVTVTGAALGDIATASYSKDLGAGIVLSAVVKATNTVRVLVYNSTGSALALTGGASGTFTAKVLSGSALALTGGGAGSFKATVLKGVA